MNQKPTLGTKGLNNNRKFVYKVAILFLIIVFGVSYFIFIKNKDKIKDDIALQSDVTKAALFSADLLNSTNLVASVKDIDSGLVAKERKKVLKRLARKNPGAFLSATIPEKERKTFSASVQAELEKNVNLTGELSTVYVDDFSNPINSRLNHYLSIGDQRYELYSIKPINIPPGTKISVSGISLDEIVVANAAGGSIKEKGPRPRLPKIDSIGEQKTAVFLVDFLDSGSQPFTAVTAEKIIFSDQGQLNAFYKEQSYGSVKFNGKVFGWFTLPRNASSGACFAANFDDISEIIAKNKINLSKYGRLVIIPSHPSMTGGCSFVGKINFTLSGINYYLSIAWVGNATYYNEPSWWGNQPFNWTNLDYILAHELGHSLGVYHANGWDCGEESIYGNCNHIEYGNYFDTMGTVGFSLHFNALYKELLGWFKSKNMAVVAQPKTIVLKPLEVSNPNSFQAVKIQMPGTSIYPYYIEYRQGIGFDSNLNSSHLSQNQNGVFINKRIDSWYPFPRLIDVTPTTSWWYDDIQKTTLNEGSSFTDQGRGITVTTKSITPKEAVIDIKFTKPQCVRRNPQIQYADYPYWEVPVGQDVYFYINFTNTDYYGCGSSTFQSTITVPAPLSVIYVYPENSKSIVAPEGEAYYYTQISIPENTPAGSYPIHYEITNITNTSFTSSTYDFILNVCEPSSCPDKYGGGSKG
ncbi:MAG: hypothetical protein AAB488_00385 [Patescibacteria group bacterium]